MVEPVRRFTARTVQVLPSEVESISSRVFGYYDKGDSITERVSKKESILSRVSGKNRIFSIGCRSSVEIRFIKLANAGSVPRQPTLTTSQLKIT